MVPGVRVPVLFKQSFFEIEMTSRIHHKQPEETPYFCLCLLRNDGLVKVTYQREKSLMVFVDLGNPDA